MSPMPRKLLVVAGQRFGRGVVIDPEVSVSGASGKRRRAAVLRCDCGMDYTALLANLAKPDHTKSCGCLRRDQAKAWAASGEPGKTHGCAGHPLFDTWRKMISRCENPQHHAYRRYGGRGIRVCERWHDLRLFVEDIERDLGPRPNGKTLDRINNDGGYQPGNVRWATAKEQAANRTRSAA